MRQQPSSRIVLAVAAVLLLSGLAAGCSGSKAPTSTQTSSSTSPVAGSGTPAATPTPAGGTSSTKAADTSGLSGTWKGKYSGVDTGTFIVKWTQSSTHLRGTIGISGGAPIPLTGIVHGSEITFGTVGSSAVTYSGRVSGDSMAGTYKVGGQAGGPWSAKRA